MQRRTIINGLILVSLFLFEHCAQVVPLSGGERDAIPPKLVEAIPGNNSTNFLGDEIVLKFDEFIQLKDVANQVIISPRIKIMPEMEVHDKTLTIKFLHQFLDPGATYRIDFGRAISDMHEGNVLENFAYVFSKGATIDTLKITGSVSSAFNNKSVANVLVGLYPKTSGQDSIAFKIEPTYFTRTNTSGVFNFYNLPISNYFVFAIDDKNKNFIYDGESEQIAMLGPPMNLISDTTMDLKMFKEEPHKNFIKKSNMPYYGFGQIILNKPAMVSISKGTNFTKGLINDINAGHLRDSILFFYSGLEDTLSLFVHDISPSKVDTLKLVVPKKQKNKKLSLTIGLNENQGVLDFKQNPILTFSNWMDTSKYDLKYSTLKCLNDSLLPIAGTKGHWLSSNRFEIKNPIKEGNSYQLNIQPNSFFSMDGISNDTLNFRFKTKTRAEFGKFNLKLKVSRQQAYVLQLLNEKEEVVKERPLVYTLFKGGSAVFSFTELLPGNYSVKIIFDNNENKKWDRGDVTSGRLPEPVIISTKRIKIISDWETEEEIILGEQN